MKGTQAIKYILSKEKISTYKLGTMSGYRNIYSIMRRKEVTLDTLIRLAESLGYGVYISKKGAMTIRVTRDEKE